MIGHLLTGLFVTILIAVAGRRLFLIVEYPYLLIFKKPLFIHFYGKLKKLTMPQLMLLRQNSKYFSRLNPKKQRYFAHRMQCFLEKYSIVSRQDAIVDDEVKMLIASAYVMLTFGMRKYLSNAFSGILVYPDSYLSTQKEQMHNGEYSPKHKAVVFSRKALLAGFANESDNLNLAIHEFAHVLTYNSIKQRDASATIFRDQYQLIIKNIKKSENAEKLKNSNYFRTYALTNEFEFVAVILEHFFESPQQFEIEFPELYQDVRLMINQ